MAGRSQPDEQKQYQREAAEVALLPHRASYLVSISSSSSLVRMTTDWLMDTSVQRARYLYASYAVLPWRAIGSVAWRRCSGTGLCYGKEKGGQENQWRHGAMDSMENGNPIETQHCLFGATDFQDFSIRMQFSPSCAELIRSWRWTLWPDHERVLLLFWFDERVLLLLSRNERWGTKP